MDDYSEITALKLMNLYKKYGEVVAVKGISLEALKGEVFGFLGPNGAGKTTTIKCCAGLLRPTDGSIFINGYDIVNQAGEAKRQLGYVPENAYLYQKLTGKEYVLFVAGLYGIDAPVSERRASRLFSLFDMSEQMDMLIEGYSRGMCQKTSLIAALLHQPTLLMLDEPTANLDPKSARVVKDIFQTYKAQEKTVFFSTHVMEIAESLCDRIAIIHKGELIASGTIEELRRLRQGTSLEEIFLQLTGDHDPKTQELLEELA